MGFHWCRALLAALAGLAGAVLAAATLPLLPGHSGLVFVPLMFALALIVATGYSFFVTQWWTIAETPPLRPFELALAHVAPAVGFCLGGGFLIAILLALRLVAKVQSR